MEISLIWLIIIIIIVIVVSCIICYYIMHNIYKSQVQSAAWTTLKYNHPDLELLFRKHAHDREFFDRVDKLMIVQDINTFNTLVQEFIYIYPDFASHMNSLTLPNDDVWKRFLNHRVLAKLIFDSIKPM